MITLNPKAMDVVEAGAAWLDKTFPDWAHDINLGELELMECRSCVLGQLFGNYHNVVVSPSTGCITEKAETLAYQLGFDRASSWEHGPYPHVSYADLQAAWEDAIEDRL